MFPAPTGYRFGYSSQTKTVNTSLQKKPPTRTGHQITGLNKNVKLTSLDRSSQEWKHIEHYFRSTQGSTHSHIQADLLDVYKIERSNETPHPSFTGEKLLLWHGTALNSVASILNMGLLKDPPEGSRRTGQMFGKGVYFADSFSKSAQYSTKHSLGGPNAAYVFLCEVSLGRVFPMFETVSQDVVDLLVSSGYHSIKGVGQNFVPPEVHHHNNDHCIPSGNLERNQFMSSGLIYNEYIVYDDQRIKLKYLVKIKD